jgi:hypothetical protein|tara:strand:- start:315 stop:620 length:306 start_codon:yes stop_codon:yes gene_type:complete
MVDKERAEELLKECFPKGSTAHTTVVHVARSGMSRHIKVFAIRGESIQNISYYVAEYLDWRYTNKEAVFVSGGGMDMGFHLIYTLSSCLYDDGYAIKQSWV